MQEADLNKNIVVLLEEAGKAHRTEFKTEFIEDPEWSLWFSEHMKDKLEVILNRHYTIGELVYLLTSAEKTHKKSYPEKDWLSYCADYLIQKR